MRPGLKIIGRKITQAGMKPVGIIKPFDIAKDISACLLSIGITLKMHPFTFEGGKETLHDRIVIAIARAAHADLDVMGSQEGLDLFAGILATPIRMMQELPAQRMTLEKSHPQGPLDQVGGDLRAHLPPHDLA